MITLQEAITGLLVLLTSLIIWFIGPFLMLGGVYPFSSWKARLLVICCLVLIYGVSIAVRWFLASKAYKNLLENFKIPEDSPKALTLKILKTFKKAFYLLRRKSIYMDMSPWFVTLYDRATDKKPLSIQGSWFSDYIKDHAPGSFKELKSLDVCLSRSALLLSYGLQDIPWSEDVSWNTCALLLRKFCGKQRFKGIILGIDLEVFLSLTRDEKEAYVKKFKERIEFLQTFSYVALPLYLVFTKSEVLQGFTDIFKNLPQEDYRKVFGLTLEESPNFSSMFEDFQKNFSRFVAKIKISMIGKLHQETDMLSRQMIFSFPQQMETLQKSLYPFLESLFQSQSYEKNPKLKGLYFVHSAQKGEFFDLYSGCLESFFQLKRTSSKQGFFWEKPAFLEGLFSFIISRKAQSYKKTGYFMNLAQHSVGMITLFSFFFFLSTKTFSSFEPQQEVLKKIYAHLHLYEKSKMSILHRKEHSFLSILADLKPLTEAYDLSIRKKNNLTSITKNLDQDISYFLKKELRAFFVPCLQETLESSLKTLSSQSETTVNLLKAYLFLGNPQGMNKEPLRRFFISYWNQDISLNDAQREVLMFYLNSVLPDLHPLALKQDLIQAHQNHITKKLPEQQIYEEIEFQTASKADFSLYHDIGPPFYKVFSQGKSSQKVSFLYTAKGFKNYFLKQEPLLIKKNLQDVHSVGLLRQGKETYQAARISKAVRFNYADNYVKQWKNLLYSLSLTPIADVSHLLSILKVMVVEDKILEKFFKIFALQTSREAVALKEVTATFERVNKFTASEDPFSLKSCVVTLHKLYDGLLALSFSPEPEKAFFQFAKERLAGSLQNDPLNELTVLASHAPHPLQKWLIQLKDRTWDLILMESKKYVEDAWREIFTPELQRAIQEKYPFASSSKEDIDLAEFKRFFSPQGEVSSFIETFLMPFLKQKKNVFENNKVDGRSLGLTPENLRSLSHFMAIQKLFFNSQPFQFTLKTYFLSKNVLKAVFKYGDKELVYRHEVPRPISFEGWTDAENLETSLMLEGIEAQKETLVTQGPWSLLRILHQAQIKKMSKSGHYQISFKRQNMKIVFELVQKDYEDVMFFKDLFHSFKLPKF